MFDLFDDHPKPDIELLPAWLGQKLAADMQRDLLSEVLWAQEHMRVPGGASVALPRVTSWQGEADAHYGYSGIKHRPSAWTPTVLELKELVEATLEVRFNSVLLSHYRSGQDSIGWHADDEPELGPEPTIAALSFGATRTFEFRHRRLAVEYAVPLHHGSLLVMRGGTQRDWRHRIAKESKVAEPRLSLTFRMVKTRHSDLAA